MPYKYNPLHDSHFSATDGNDGASASEDRIGFVVVSSNQIVAGTKAYKTVPYNCTMSNWYLDADASGSITVNVRKGMVTPAAIVGAGTKPFLSAAASNSGAVSTWDVTTLSEGDILVFDVEAGATVNKITMTIDITKS